MGSELDYNDSSSEEKDIKPIVLPVTTTASGPFGIISPGLVSNSKKWSPSSLQDINRKSAFQPYKQTSICTVLTNLQRGNTQTETLVAQNTDINFHTKAGQGEITQQDIKNEKDVDICDCNGLTALHWAAAHGQSSTVQLLINNGAVVDKLGPEEETPLLLAASGGHHEVIRLLLNNGADINHVDHFVLAAPSVLPYYPRNTSFNVEFLDKSDMETRLMENQINELCNSALMYAAKGNHPHTCQELLLNGANYTLSNLNDDTAYTVAVANNSYLAQAVIQKFILSTFEI